VLEHLPERRPPRRAELTVGYRVPGPIMDLAARVLPLAAPGLTPPSSIRHTGDEPVVLGVAEDLLDVEIAETVREELKVIGAGNVAVIAVDEMVDRVVQALERAGVEHGRATRQGLDRQVTVVPVSLAKGLELDSVVVVEPGRILTDATRGAQSLYVALTRSTKRLTLLHTGELPTFLS
jgi:DNA helicase IV